MNSIFSPIFSGIRSKEYRGEQLKVIMDAIDYGIGTDYLQLFDDTSIPAGIMKNMLIAMKEDYGVQEAAFFIFSFQFP